MSTNEQFDYIIAGAGAAGLSLVSSILSNKALGSKRILLIDQHMEPAKDKTWSFWSNESHPITQYASRSWRNVSVSAHQRYFSTKLSGLRYYCVKSEDYSTNIFSKIETSEQVTMLKASVLEFISDDSKVTVRTDKGDYSGDWCFQSVFKKPLHEAESQEEIRLLQHFMGWEIEVRRPLFRDDEVTLMDFDTPQGDGVTFFYVLPFTPTFALVEFTMFSAHMLSIDDYEMHIRRYLNDKFNLGSDDYTISRKEVGAIPMETVRFSPWLNARTLNMGMIGGHTKPSTGYTFMRIQSQVQRIVHNLVQDTEPHHDGGSSYRFRVYDMMLLSILDQHPQIGIQIFHDLFKKNSMELVFKFLDEKTNIIEELKIFSTLPYLPFLKSIVRMRTRILNGA